MFEKTELERLSAVNGNDDAFAMTSLREDMMTSVDAGELPASMAQNPHEILT